MSGPRGQNSLVDLISQTFQLFPNFPTLTMDTRLCIEYARACQILEVWIDQVPVLQFDPDTQTTTLRECGEWLDAFMGKPSQNALSKLAEHVQSSVESIREERVSLQFVPWLFGNIPGYPLRPDEMAAMIRRQQRSGVHRVLRRADATFGHAPSTPTTRTISTTGGNTVEGGYTTPSRPRSEQLQQPGAPERPRRRRRTESLESIARAVEVPPVPVSPTIRAKPRTTRVPFLDSDEEASEATIDSPLTRTATPTLSLEVPALPLESFRLGAPALADEVKSDDEDGGRIVCTVNRF
jgi:hypothetical protein